MSVVTVAKIKSGGRGATWKGPGGGAVGASCHASKDFLVRLSRAQKSTAQFEPPSSSRSSSSGSPPPFLPFDSRQRPSEPGKKQSSYNEPLRIGTYTRFSQTRLSTHTREQSKIFVPDFAPPSPPFCVHSFARAERRKEGRREKKRQRGSEIKRWRGREKENSESGTQPLVHGKTSTRVVGWLKGFIPRRLSKRGKPVRFCCCWRGNTHDQIHRTHVCRWKTNFHSCVPLRVPLDLTTRNPENPCHSSDRASFKPAIRTTTWWTGRLFEGVNWIPGSSAWFSNSSSGWQPDLARSIFLRQNFWCACTPHVLPTVERNERNDLSPQLRPGTMYTNHLPFFAPRKISTITFRRIFIKKIPSRFDRRSRPFSAVGIIPNNEGDFVEVPQFSPILSHAIRDIWSFLCARGIASRATNSKDVNGMISSSSWPNAVFTHRYVATTRMARRNARGGARFEGRRPQREGECVQLRSINISRILALVARAPLSRRSRENISFFFWEILRRAPTRSF